MHFHGAEANSFVCLYFKSKNTCSKSFSCGQFVMMGVLCSGFSCCDGLIFVYLQPADAHKGSVHNYGLRVCVGGPVPCRMAFESMVPRLHCQCLEETQACSVSASSFSRRLELQPENDLVCGEAACPSEYTVPPVTSGSRAKTPSQPLAPFSEATSLCFSFSSRKMLRFLVFHIHYT